MVQEPLTLVATFPFGSGTLEATPEHPLLTPLRLAIVAGKPPGRWAWFAVQEAFIGVFKLIGSFVHSPGDRLLFFPGAEVLVIPGKQDERFNEKRIDHLTLDPPDVKGRHKSHVAVFGIPGKDSRGINYSTKPPEGLLVPWFTLVSDTLAGFETLPSELRVTFPPPRPDVQSFGQELLGGIGFQAMPLPTGVGPNFFQLDVWAGRGREWKGLGARPLAWAYKAELVADAPAEHQQIQVVQLDIEFSDSVGLRVQCSRPGGRLRSSGANILRPTLQW